MRHITMYLLLLLLLTEKGCMEDYPKPSLMAFSLQQLAAIIFKKKSSSPCFYFLLLDMRTTDFLKSFIRIRI